VPQLLVALDEGLCAFPHRRRTPRLPAFILRILSIHVPLFLPLPSSSFLFLPLPSSSFLFLPLPSSAFLCLPLPSSAFLRSSGALREPRLPRSSVSSSPSASSALEHATPLAQECLCSPHTTTSVPAINFHQRNTTPHPIAPAPGSNHARPTFILPILSIHVPLCLSPVLWSSA